MIWGLTFRLEVEDEMQEVYDFYEAQKTNLGELFLDSVDRALESVCANPLIYRERLKGIRVKRLVKFPYAIYFTMELGRVKVLSIIHNKRNRDWIEMRLT